MEALKQYITVKYVRMADFLLECTVAWDEKRYDKVLQAYARPKLFIIDEWLDIELTKNDLHAIKELVHRRRRKSSTIFCSQILKEGWYQALGGENTEAEAIIDRITYDGYDINIEYTGLHMAFFNSAVGVLQTLVVALGAGLGIWGAINLLEGYGNDNPGAKSQGMKQLMAGGGVALIGITLVPLLSGLFG